MQGNRTQPWVIRGPDQSKHPFDVGDLGLAPGTVVVKHVEDRPAEEVHGDMSTAVTRAAPAWWGPTVLWSGWLTRGQPVDD